MEMDRCDGAGTGALMDLIRSGDEEAFRAVFRRYGERVYKRVLDATGDKAAARAVTRETFLEMARLLREQPESDAYALWADALARKNAETARIARHDMAQVERELFETARSDKGAPAPASAPEPPARASAPEPTAPAFDSLWNELNAALSPPAPPHGLPTDAYAPAPPAVDASVPRRRASPLRIVAIVLLAALICVLLWGLAGILMDLDILPELDLGYTWFGDNVYPLF